MRRLGVAGLQLDLAKTGNFGLIEAELRSLKKRFPFVDLVLLSELATQGVDPKLAEDEGRDSEARYCALATELGLWLVPGSIFQRGKAGVYNSSPVIDPQGNVITRYHKMFPFKPHEKGVECGSDFVVFEIPGVGKVGVSNCFDMWFPETTRSLAAMGAELILHPSLTGTVDRDVEIEIARANAAMFQVYFLDVNGAGAHGNGRSGMYGPGGEVIYRAGIGRDIMAFDIDLDEVRHVRENGWHGLGQMMKSFRDSEVEFPYHTLTGRRTPELEQLGPLTLHNGKCGSQISAPTNPQNPADKGE